MTISWMIIQNFKFNMTIVLFIKSINLCIIHTQLSIYLCLSVRLLVFSYVSVSVFVVCASICLSLSVLLSVWFFVVCVAVCIFQVTCLDIPRLSLRLSLYDSLWIFLSVSMFLYCVVLYVSMPVYKFWILQLQYKSIYMYIYIYMCTHSCTSHLICKQTHMRVSSYVCIYIYIY